MGDSTIWESTQNVWQSMRMSIKEIHDQGG